MAAISTRKAFGQSRPGSWLKVEALASGDVFRAAARERGTVGTFIWRRKAQLESVGNGKPNCPELLGVNI